MLRHYVLHAIRGFARQPLHACLAIAVLTLGLMCFLGAAVFVLYLDRYDTQFRSYERLHVVYERSYFPQFGRDSGLGEQSDAKLEEQLELVAPELAAVARLSLISRSVAVEGGEPRSMGVGFADAAWADLFDLETVAGAVPRTVLEQPRGAIVTEDVARQLFGAEPAVGKTLRISEVGGRAVDVTIGAVVKALPVPSHLARDPLLGRNSLQVAASWAAFEVVSPALRTAPWGAWRVGTTYAVLPPNGSLTAAELNRRLQLLGERLSADPANRGMFSFEARHVSRLIKDRLQGQLRGPQGGAGLPVQVTTLLLAFAGLVLGVAGLNFVNLATARSASRAREIGVRKSLGASAREVLRQDFAETGVAVAVSIVLALAVVTLGGRLASERWQAALVLPWWQPQFWLLLGGLLAIVTALAGAYPAAVLARIRPMAALRLGIARAGPRPLRAVLVGVQCAAAAFLVFAVVVFHLQTETVRAAALGRFDDPVVVLGEEWRYRAQPGGGIDVLPFDTLSAELRRGPGILGVAGMNTYPWYRALASNGPASRSPAPDGPAATSTGIAHVTTGFRELLDVPLLAGRWFADERADEPRSGADATGPGHVVIDERAARALGFASPEAAVGELVYGAGGTVYASGDNEIIGVVASTGVALRSEGVDDGFVYWLAPRSAIITLVRLDRQRVAEALAHIESVRKALAPSASAGTPQFLDAAFEAAYSTFSRLSRVVTILAAFAIAIAAIGIFGMASFLAARRTREIGLRKTQGATTRSILRLLLTDFSKPVLIANVAIWPLAYVAARAYVNLFVERMSITPLPFVATLAATLLLAWLVIGARVVRAASVSPTVALRHE